MGKANRAVSREMREEQARNILAINAQVAKYEKVGPITLAWLHPGDVSGVFTDSLWNTLAWDATHGFNFLRGGCISLESGPRVAEGRSQIVTTFLTNDMHKESEWLLFVDADMGWTDEGINTLMETLDRETTPIVAGLCFAGGRAGIVYPTLYRILDESGELETISDYPRDALVKVDATGAAFICIHRSVLLQMADVFGKQPNGTLNPYPWFVEGMVNKEGHPYGEDIVFCLRANHLGIPIYVHTGIRTVHRKAYDWDESDFDRLQQSHAEPVEA